MSQMDLRLPNLTEGDADTQLRQLRSYLYQLTEQLQLALGARTQVQEPLDRQALLQETLALTVKQFAARCEAFLEAPWQRQLEALEQLRQALAALEDRPAPAPACQAIALCQADTPGFQVQTGERVGFTPLPSFTHTADGHWLLE